MKFATPLILLAVVTSTVVADETWMYPVRSPGTAGFLKSNDIRTASYAGRIIDVEFASFDGILKWYSDKIDSAAVSDALVKYKNRKPDAADVNHGSATAHNGNSGRTTIVTYVFTPNRKHITILHPIDDGEIVVISLLGTKKNTGIQIIQRHTPATGG